MPLLLAIALLLLLAPAALAAWQRPVPGAVTRPFAYGPDPFAPGLHRGVDLAAPPGTPVRSACAGVVVFAGVVPRHGRTVTVRCGRFRVTYAPLARPSVRRGSAVGRGSSVGAADRGHGGLHVGVRRVGDPFGYVDPLRRFGAGEPPPVAVRVPRAGPRSVRPPGRVRPPRPVVSRPLAAPSPGVAPWPVWLGLGLLLIGAVGGTTLRRRRRATPRATATASLGRAP